MKSVRLRIAAKLVWVLGLLSCIIGSGVYALLCLPEVLNLPYQPLYFAAAGAAAVVYTIIAIILSAASKAAARDEALEAAWLEEMALAAQAAEEAAQATEVEIPAEEAPATKKKLTDRVLAKMHLKPEALTLAKKAAAIAVPVVATCIVNRAVAKSRAKKAQDRRRQDFYRWLG